MRAAKQEEVGSLKWLLKEAEAPDRSEGMSSVGVEGSYCESPLHFWIRSWPQVSWYQHEPGDATSTDAVKKEEGAFMQEWSFETIVFSRRRTLQGWARGALSCGALSFILHPQDLDSCMQQYMAPPSALSLLCTTLS